MISRAYDLFTREAARVARCDELYTAITESITNKLRGTDDRALDSDGRPKSMILEFLPRIRTVTDIPSLELFLSFLESLPGEIRFFDLHHFLGLAGERRFSAVLSGRFLYRVYLTVGEFAGDFDVRDGALGLVAYRHLNDYLSQDGSEDASFALIKAAKELGDWEHGRFTTGGTFVDTDGKRRPAYCLKDQELATFIAANHERVDDIIDALISRGDFPGADAMLEIINSDSKALSLGML